MIQCGRPQVRRNPLHRRDADLDQADQRLDAIDRLAIDALLPERSGGPRQFELDGRQRLAELVVQLAREVRSLFFARCLHARRQLTQLLSRLPPRRLSLSHVSWFVHEISTIVHDSGPGVGLTLTGCPVSSNRMRKCPTLFDTLDACSS